MKLYTEQQVRNLLEKMCLATEKNNLGVPANFRHRAIEINKLIDSLTPIKLPSDSEIHEELDIKFNHRWNIVSLGVYDGAKFMRDKIQGGDK
jgi:hypothetical protein